MHTPPKVNEKALFPAVFRVLSPVFLFLFENKELAENIVEDDDDAVGQHLGDKIIDLQLVHQQDHSADVDAQGKQPGRDKGEKFPEQQLPRRASALKDIELVRDKGKEHRDDPGDHLGGRVQRLPAERWAENDSRAQILQY